jgi:uncharacterized membrane protein YvbJ
MRLRYSPCIGSRETAEKAKIRLFRHFSPKSSITIIVQNENNKPIFSLQRFGKKHLIFPNFKVKYTQIYGIFAK